ncbi:MAG: DNA-processing protein DprA [Candidatus Komeilibacteria bacterium]
MPYNDAPPDELAALMAWQQIPGVGKQLLLKIRDHFGSFLIAWNATADPDPTWQQLLTKTQLQRQITQPTQVANSHLKNNPDIISLIDSDYPAGLASSYPEPLLYYRGNRQLLQNKIFLGVVGSRRFDHYNAAALKTIFSGLAGAPVVIVSGLAIGIDGLAHQLALHHNLPTIAIPGSSVADAEIYPRSNLRLSREIIAVNGLLLSPFPQGTLVESHLFPYRNAIIAGLCQALLVVSAASKSGALITAQLAMDMGREVLAIPGNINQELAAGCNRLIQQGAYPVTGGNDILQQLNLETRPNTYQQVYSGASEIELAVINLLKIQPLAIENIIQQLPNYPTNQLMAALAAIELKDWLEKSNNVMRLK